MSRICILCNRRIRIFDRPDTYSELVNLVTDGFQIEPGKILLFTWEHADATDGTVMAFEIDPSAYEMIRGGDVLNCYVVEESPAPGVIRCWTTGGRRLRLRAMSV